MFNTFCFTLNVLHLSRVSAFLRWSIYRWMLLRHNGNALVETYAQPVAGFWGWIPYRPFGVLAFVDMDGKLHFRW